MYIEFTVDELELIIDELRDTLNESCIAAPGMRAELELIPLGDFYESDVEYVRVIQGLINRIKATLDTHQKMNTRTGFFDFFFRWFK